MSRSTFLGGGAQTTDHHPPLSGTDTPPPESTYLLLHRGSLPAAHIPQKLSSLSFVGSHVFGKILFLWQRWTGIRTLHPILRTRTIRCLRRCLSCALSAMRSCATLSHVLMATAMSGIKSSAGLLATVRVRLLGHSFLPKTSPAITPCAT
jgi:hypothetical protein